jgi:hypothetical protein
MPAPLNVMQVFINKVPFETFRRATTCMCHFMMKCLMCYVRKQVRFVLCHEASVLYFLYEASVSLYYVLCKMVLGVMRNVM